MTIKAVFFDAAGTLIKPSRGVGESYATFAAKYGVHVSPGDVSERFRGCFANAPGLAFPDAAEGSIDTLERQWWQRLVSEIFHPWSPITCFDEFFDELFAYFAEPSSWTVYPEVVDTLGLLTQQGMTLGVISNFDSRLVQILNGLGIGSSFQNIFVSSRIGYAKPDRRIFHAALAHYALGPQQGLHVGDSEINDRQGAKNAGLRGLLVDRSGTADSADPEVVASLKAIVDLLE